MYDDKPMKKASKSGGGGANLKMGLSSQAGMGSYAEGDAKDDNLPKGGGSGSASKGGKTFPIC
jgi:hypothetical protein